MQTKQPQPGGRSCFAIEKENAYQPATGFERIDSIAPLRYICNCHRFLNAKTSNNSLLRQGFRFLRLGNAVERRPARLAERAVRDRR
jgi:hypothetical protein